MWQDLIAVLHELVAAYQEHTVIGEQKRLILISSDLKKLESILKKQEKTIARIERAEKKRKQILTYIATEHHHISTDINAQELYQIAPKELQAPLAEIHQKLLDIVEENRKMTENNEILATAALSAVKIKLNELADTSIDPTYGKQGEEKITTTQKEWNA